MNASRNAGRARRRDQVRELLDKEGLESIVIGRPPNFAWYSGGADNRVDHSSPVGVASIVVTLDAEYVLADSIETERMRVEQTPHLEVREFPWYESSPLQEMVARGYVGTDFSLQGAREIGSSLAPLRWVLDQTAIELYRQVGNDTSDAMDETIGQLGRGVSEWEAMAVLEASCRRRGLFTPVTMAAADDRITRFRHPVAVSATSATNATAAQRLMLVVCAERGGLYANVTRWVHFEEPGDAWHERYEACGRILHRMREEATRPGRTLAEAFQDCQSFYADEGFPEEWRLHHQGGMTGYLTREIVAAPTTEQKIEIGQAFAWNPSITGAKTEETMLLTKTGAEVLVGGGSAVLVSG